ncbi:MAG: RNA-guided endonuclease InsQ/TnpB family protein [Acidimicrobiia bacterium]
MGSSVHRTARIGLRLTRGQARRCYGLLRAAGDVWAALIEVNAARFDRGGRPIANSQEWCREIAGVTCGELSVTAMGSVVRRYSEAFFETARRKRRGERARYPRRKRALFPTRWYRGTFTLDSRRVRLSVATGRPDLWVRLARPMPYPLEQVRSVTLVAEAGRLFLDVTAAVPVAEHGLEPGRVAGVDIGIIHPFAAACDDEALVVSGRAIRAEERLHLADTKARAARMSRKAPRRGQKGSKRWRKLRATRRRAEARHQRRVRLAHHQAAKTLVAWAIAHRIGTLAVGDLAGITNREMGRRQNLRLRQWRRTHLVGALRDKAEAAGIRLVVVDEHATSSTCPECSTIARPSGRNFTCLACGHREHRDVLGARNIAARSGGTTRTPVRVTHRRAGHVPARRDRRRHLWDQRRSGLAHGRPGCSPGSRSLRRRTHGDALAATAPRAQPSALSEDPPNLAEHGERTWTEH